MAIVQVSRITNRKGLQENLPQLSGAELGWAIDTRRLYIGNGTLQEGAPVIGNTEILTEFSDITVLSNYTYADVAVGYAAQTGPTASQPVVRSVQAKLDDMASVRDFGAVGDGITDDTAAINRALYQLYCRESNTAIRRTLFFPAGTYITSDSLIIPTYAKLVGEGANHSIILMAASSSLYAAQFGDSLQQTGVNIGTNGATPPRNIEISGMTFQTTNNNDVFLVDRAESCWFSSVEFVGAVTTAQITSGFSDDIACVRFESGAGLVINDITFDKCAFKNSTYGVNTDTEMEGITISNSYFSWLIQGISLDSSGGPGPSGFRALHNIFDDVYAEAIVYDDVNLNVSAYNVFYNVGYNIGSPSPITPVIRFGNDNNVSINDLFQRSDADAYTVPRVQITASTATAGGVLSQSGRLFQSNGKTFTLLDNQTAQTIFSLNNDNVKAFKMLYTISRTTSVRMGTLTVVSGPDDSTGAMSYNDDYTENDDTGITLSVAQSGSQVSVRYTSTNTGNPGVLTYSITHLA